MSTCRFETILIANRGEIARRIIRTCRRLGIRSVAVYSDADAGSPHVTEADEAIRIGPAAAAHSYLHIPAILDAAARAGADAIHPGYGFLSENAALAYACEAAGRVFIGPPPEAIAAMGDKRAARVLAAGLGLPVIPGYDGPEQDDETLTRQAAQIGYPVMVKAAAGGGGKGMRLVDRPGGLAEALAGARREAENAFGSGDLLLERALSRPRHIEIQVFADRHGRILHLGERECTIQRRHQKVIEESPAPGLSDALRATMGAAAVTVAAAIGYTGAGTVEFLLGEDGQYYFLEMNTRLQVEHPVTELVTGLDLVEWQIRVAEGEALPWSQEAISLSGHAIEARIYAEDAAAGFLPATGTVLLWRPPRAEGIRVDDGIAGGSVITSNYDPLLAKIIASGPTRADALRRLRRALADTVLFGVMSNLSYLAAVVAHPGFVEPQALSTRFLEESFPDWRPETPAEETTVALIAVTLARWLRLNGSGTGYWRNNPSDPAPLCFELAGDSFAVRVRPVPRMAAEFHVTLSPGESHHVFLDELGESDVTFTLDGHHRHITLISAGAVWWVEGGSGMRVIEHPLLPEPRLPAGAGGSLRAPLPGVVLAVLVAVGQAVEAGQPLMKLEAMKMEHTVRTAAAGVIEAIFYAPGDVVEADALLVKIRD